MQIAILGRQTGISLAELESIYGASKITPIDLYAALVDTDQPLPQAQLGGTMKSATLLKRLENTDLKATFAYLQEFLPDYFLELPEGKLQFGISLYGFLAKRDWLLRQMLILKKLIKNSGRSIRVIENKNEALEAAQILYNKLTSALGCEILLIRDGTDVIIAKTTAVQDIDAYATRDFGRPMRDAYVGMLPPKLAQIMINLTFDSNKPNPDNHRLALLDPFCGTGVILQEALLMNYEVFGTDISQKMIEYTRANLAWLQDTHTPLGTVLTVETADATAHHWREANILDAVVCETYLGKPLSSLPKKEELTTIVDEANQIAERFLRNIAPQLITGTRLCIALPAWYLGEGAFHHLKVLDHIEDLGYNRLDLTHAKNTDLIYHRKNQTVARELTILVRS